MRNDIKVLVPIGQAAHGRVVAEPALRRMIAQVAWEARQARHRSPIRKEWAKYRSLAGAVASAEIRTYQWRWGGGKALFVKIDPASPPSSHVPLLEEVADLRHADLRKWADFLNRHGIPGSSQEAPLQLKDGSIVVRVPLTDLREIASVAMRILTAEDAILRAAEAARRSSRRGHPRMEVPPAPRRTDAAARRLIAQSLAEALRVLTPRTTQSERPGLTSEWQFMTPGWWPLAVLRELVQRERYGRLCAAPGCGRVVPPERKKYCSNRCYWREKQRRHRKPRHNNMA